jgi:hypothetical protein
MHKKRGSDFENFGARITGIRVVVEKMRRFKVSRTKLEF